MLDLKFVREHQDEVEQALKNRGQESPWMSTAAARPSAASS